MGCVSGAGCAGQVLLEALGMPGPEISHWRGDDPSSLIFLGILQEKGYTKGPFTSPGGFLPLQSLHTGLVLPRGAKPVRP